MLLRLECFGRVLVLHFDCTLAVLGELLHLYSTGLVFGDDLDLCGFDDRLVVIAFHTFHIIRILINNHDIFLSIHLHFLVPAHLGHIVSVKLASLFL